MISEVKILFNNIKRLKNLLTEGVSENDIINAINNHEWVYLYYDADNDRKAKEFRTVRIYVLGTHKTSGKKVIRAWQDNPKNSWHFDKRPTRKDSKNHDFWVDSEGNKPGWRMFNVENIIKILPTGKKFHDSNGLVMIPQGYHEGGDDNMSSIDAYVSTKNQPDFEYKYDKEFYGVEKKPSELNKEKWDSIRRGNKNSVQITRNDVIKLRDLVSRFHKRKLSNYLVVVDDKKNYQLITIKDKDRYKIPDSAIIGDLPYLSDVFINKKQVDDRRYIEKLNKIKKEVSKKSLNVNEIENISTIPYKKTTLFKNL